MSTPLSGGYCGGVPPLPIPNREVKPTCADGTAMQCGRVGSRLFFLRSTLEIYFFRVLFLLYAVLNTAALPYRLCADGTPCQIGQCERVGSRLFSYEALWRFISSECFFCLPSTPQFVRWYTLSNKAMRESG